MSERSDSEDRNEKHPVHEEQHTVTHGSFVPGEQETETHSRPVGSFADQNQSVDDDADAPAAGGEDADNERVGRFDSGPDTESDYVTTSEPEGSYDEVERKQ